ncbi:hypothetical protein B7494_g1089 [Chlorociboria aeruginascens]|nr:hypothetical protein B7494_g1089 [Chlorociboria aeruginascens]
MSSDISQVSTATSATSVDSFSHLPHDKMEGLPGYETPKPRRAGTGQTEVPEPETQPHIIYHVKYKSSSGDVTEVKRPTEPFKLKPTISDVPVLEVHTTVVPIDGDQEKIASLLKEAKEGKKEEKSDSNDGKPDSKDDKDVKDSKDPEGSKVSKDTKEAANINDPDAHPENFKISETTLRIRSRKLLNALRAVVRYYPGQTLLGDTVSFSEPFKLLVHHRTELEAYKTQNVEGHSEDYKKESNEHIDVLLKFLKNYFGKSLEDEEKRHQQNPPVCTFEYVWLLLKPGEPSFVQGDREQYFSYNVKKATGGMVGGRPTTYEVALWNVQCDGYELGRSPSRCAILPFDGEKEIKTLIVFPARFYKESKKELEKHNGMTIQQRFVARGRKYWELTRSYAYKRYEGTTTTKPYKQIDGRIVVDFDTFYSQRPGDRPYLVAAWVPEESEDGDETATGTSGCECEICASKTDKSRQALYQDYDGVSTKKKPPNEDNFFFLCSRRVPAFILSDRSWQYLDAELVKDVDVEPNVFKNLVLPSEIKETIEALCRTHMRLQSTNKSFSTDFIKGKGEGLIFLLYGPPGVGKTCTAECIAELLGRPLLALTCSDLGTTAESVSEQLDNYLMLGELWDAVVLLDEADIYFEERAPSDVKRNSLVTVFLRALEYYRGLLFLTTNRVNIFDEAFKSRVHVSLHYRKLTRDQQSAIWNNSFDRVEKQSTEEESVENYADEKKVDIKEVAKKPIIVTKTARKYILEDPALLDLKWNGREIQHAFQTALALAHFDAEEKDKEHIRVTKNHLKRVVDMSKLFSAYLESMKGGRNGEEVALQHRLRNDDFGSENQPKLSKKAQVAAAAKKKKAKKVVESESESEEDESEAESEEVEEVESEDEKPKKGRKTTTTKIKKTIVREEEDEEEEEEEEEVEKKKKKKGKKVGKKEVKPVVQNEEVDEEEEEEEEEE